MECNPQFGPKHKGFFFTVFLIKKCDQQPLQSPLPELCKLIKKIFKKYIVTMQSYYNIIQDVPVLVEMYSCSALSNVLVLSHHQCTRTLVMKMYSAPGLVLMYCIYFSVTALLNLVID